MIGGWVVSAVIRFSGNGISYMRGLGAETTRLNAVLDTHTSKIQRAEAALESYRMKMLHFGATASGALAVAAGAFAAYGVMGAAQLQRSLIGVQVATNDKSASSMRQYAALAFRTSGVTAQDVNTIGQEMAIAATSGLNNRAQLADAFTRIAKAADMLWISPKGTDPKESVRAMSQMAHLFGVYSGAPFQHMLDRAAEMMFVQPEGIDRLVTQGRYFIPTALQAGVSEDDIFKQAMMMGQTGFMRGRGGSGLSNVIGYLSGAATVTGHLSAAQHKAMHELGLTNAQGTLRAEFTKHGNLLLQKVVDHLEAIRNNFGGTEFMALLRNAFLKQGGNFLGAELLPNVYQKSKQNWQRMNQIGTVDTLFHTYSNNFLYQWNIFWTNLVNIPKAIFFPLLDDMKDVLLKWNVSLKGVVDFLVSHPDIAKRWGEGIIAFAGVMTVTWGAFSAFLVRQAILMPIAALKLEAALSKLTATIEADGTIIGAGGTAAAGGLGRLAAGILGLVNALGIGSAILSVAGLLYGAHENAAWSKKHPALAHWFQSGGANRGEVPPGTEGTVDVFGRPIHHAPAYILPHGMRAPSAHAVNELNRALNPTHVHVNHVSINFPNVKDGEGAKVAMLDLFNNPRSLLYTSALGTRTHAHLPQALTVAPA